MSSKSRKTPRTLLNLFDSADPQLLQSVEDSNGPEPKQQADTSRNKVQTSEVPHDTERGAARYCGAGSSALRVHRRARPGGESRWQMRNRAPSSYPQDTIHNHGISFPRIHHPEGTRPFQSKLLTHLRPYAAQPFTYPIRPPTSARTPRSRRAGYLLTTPTSIHPALPPRNPHAVSHHVHTHPPTCTTQHGHPKIPPPACPRINLHRSPPKNPPHRNTKHTRTRSNLIWFRVAG
jgi:hypothetical protein